MPHVLCFVAKLPSVSGASTLVVSDVSGTRAATTPVPATTSNAVSSSTSLPLTVANAPASSPGRVAPLLPRFARLATARCAPRFCQPRFLPLGFVGRRRPCQTEIPPPHLRRFDICSLLLSGLGDDPFFIATLLPRPVSSRGHGRSAGHLPNPFPRTPSPHCGTHRRARARLLCAHHGAAPPGSSPTPPPLGPGGPYVGPRAIARPRRPCMRDPLFSCRFAPPFFRTRTSENFCGRGGYGAFFGGWRSTAFMPYFPRP